MDLRCHLVTGAGEPRRIVEVARAAAAGGAGVIQVRSKPLPDRALLQLVREISRAVAGASPRSLVLVDDRVDVALIARREGLAVHGVHLGQEDLPARAARRLLGPTAVIGLTTGTRELITAANRDADVLDYVGAGPMRPTPTKESGRRPIGVAGYPDLVAASRLPVVAIGDVTPDDAPALAGTGVAGVAICRALMRATDPAAAVRRVLGALGGPDPESKEKP